MVRAVYGTAQACKRNSVRAGRILAGQTRQPGQPALALQAGQAWLSEPYDLGSLYAGQAYAGQSRQAVRRSKGVQAVMRAATQALTSCHTSCMQAARLQQHTGSPRQPVVPVVLPGYLPEQTAP